MLSMKKSGALSSSFYYAKKRVVIMNEIINLILSILITLGMMIFCGIIIALNYIDEIIEWLEKKQEKKNKV